MLEPVRLHLGLDINVLVVYPVPDTTETQKRPIGVTTAKLVTRSTPRRLTNSHNSRLIVGATT